MRSAGRFFAAFALLLLLTFSSIDGQSNATLQGRVLDSSGAVLPGATIQVPFTVTLPQTTNYTATVSLLDPTGWAPPPTTNLVNFPGTTGQVRTVIAQVTATGTAATTKLKLRVEKQTDASVFGEDLVDIRRA